MPFKVCYTVHLFTFSKHVLEVSILYTVFSKYALIDFLSPKHTVNTDLLLIRISNRIIRISQQIKHRD